MYCFLALYLLACLLFLTGTDAGFLRIALASFPVLLSLLFLLYCFSAFPFFFFFFLIILRFLINFICQFFPSLHIFSSGDPIFFPQNNQPLPFIFVYLSFS